MSQVLPHLLGGLGLFLFAIFKLSEVLQSIFTDKATELIGKYTSNIFLSIFIGTVMTVLLGSSSAGIIIVIVFINSKILTLRQSMGLILGANFGTTFSSKIIAMDIGEYSVIPLLVGLFVMLLAKNLRIKRIATVIMYFGILFFGLFTIEQSVLPLHDSELFVSWMQSIESNAFKGAIFGGFITLIIQSSSATVGMAIILANQNILNLLGGLSIMLGAELGTCSDTLMATVGGSREALKAALFHLIFSLLSIAIALIFFTPFVNLVTAISRSQDIGNQIANGHVLFNVLGVILCLPFLGVFEKALNKILP